MHNIELNRNKRDGCYNAKQHNERLSDGQQAFSDLLGTIRQKQTSQSDDKQRDRKQVKIRKSRNARLEALAHGTGNGGKRH